MRLTVIFCIRDKPLRTIMRSFYSLKAQNLQNYKVAIVDYGSTNDLSKSIKIFTKPLKNWQYFYCESTGLPWNRSHALNIGIRNSQTEYVFTADIDLLFDPDFTAHLEGLMNHHDAVFMPCYLLPKKFDRWNDYFKLKNFEKTTEQGKGLSLIKTSILKEIQGYDEFYNYWGREDNDLYNRLVSMNINPVFIHDPCLLYHQWHPLTAHSHQTIPTNWNEYMKNYFSWKQGAIRNDENWGKLLSRADRVALRVQQSAEPFHIFFENIRGDQLMFLETLVTGQFHNNKNIFLVVHSNDIKQYTESRSAQCISMVNSLLSSINSHIRITSENRSLYYSVYEIRDKLIHFVLNHLWWVKDYLILVHEKDLTVEFIAVKK